LGAGGKCEKGWNFQNMRLTTATLLHLKGVGSLRRRKRMSEEEMGNRMSAIVAIRLYLSYKKLLKEEAKKRGQSLSDFLGWTKYWKTLNKMKRTFTKAPKEFLSAYTRAKQWSL
jgi:hypothetical protein